MVPLSPSLMSFRQGERDEDMESTEESQQEQGRVKRWPFQEASWTVTGQKTDLQHQDLPGDSAGGRTPCSVRLEQRHVGGSWVSNHRVWLQS